MSEYESYFLLKSGKDRQAGGSLQTLFLFLSHALADDCARSDIASIGAILAMLQLAPHIHEELAAEVARLWPTGEYVAVRSSASMKMV